MKDISGFLDKSTDEIIAIVVVTPITGVLCYLAMMGTIPPEILLGPIGMVLGHFFTKAK